MRKLLIKLLFTKNERDIIVSGLEKGVICSFKDYEKEEDELYKRRVINRKISEFTEVKRIFD